MMWSYDNAVKKSRQNLGRIVITQLETRCVTLAKIQTELSYLACREAKQNLRERFRRQSILYLSWRRAVSIVDKGRSCDNSVRKSVPPVSRGECCENAFPRRHAREPVKLFVVYAIKARFRWRLRSYPCGFARPSRRRPVFSGTRIGAPYGFARRMS